MSWKEKMREARGAGMAEDRKELGSEGSRRAAAPTKEDSWMSY